MTIPSIRPNRVEVVISVQRRWRWTPEQKLEIVNKTNEPRSSVSLIDSHHGLTAAQLFQWRKVYFEGSLVVVGAKKPFAGLKTSKRHEAHLTTLSCAWSHYF